MKRPVLYYTVAMYLGCFSMVAFNFSNILSIIITLLFLLIIYLYENFKSFIFITCFFIIGCISVFVYFNVDIGNSASFRIVEVKRWQYIGNYRGRIVYLEGDLNSISAGDRINVDGRFISKKDFTKGSIGSYKINNYSKKDVDLLKKLYILKEDLYEGYKEALGQEKASIIMATCYGDTKYLSYEQKEKFMELGISHVISVSGFHIAIVYKLLEKILGLKLALILSGVYMIFTGSEAATARAFIMILIFKISKSVYRNYHSITALCIAALFLLLVKPYYVIDIGFNLSFLATLGIILYNKKLQKIFYKLPKSINESLSITLSSQVFSMPYAMGTINNISMFFIAGNLLLLPLYSIVVILGNLGIIVYKIKPIFHVITTVLYPIQTTIDGLIYTLLKVSPPLSKYNVFYSFCAVIIFTSFIFVKYGYSKIKYLPMFLLGLIIMYNMV